MSCCELLADALIGLTIAGVAPLNGWALCAEPLQAGGRLRSNCAS